MVEIGLLREGLIEVIYAAWKKRVHADGRGNRARIVTARFPLPLAG